MILSLGTFLIVTTIALVTSHAQKKSAEDQSQALGHMAIALAMLYFQMRLMFWSNAIPIFHIATAVGLLFIIQSVKNKHRSTFLQASVGGAVLLTIGLFFTSPSTIFKNVQMCNLTDANEDD